MKILIIGEYSYIGTSLEEYLGRCVKDWQVDKLSVRTDDWKEYDFTPYDVVFHAAGKAHADVGKISEAEKQEYYRVNRDLTVEVAQKAKESGVRQFIYPSSIIIYGESAPCGQTKVITADTKPMPANFYGDSKLQADLAIGGMSDDAFHTVVLRLPMIYGKGSRGNYPLLSKMAKKLPVFPDVKNERSMLYIENLCQFIIELIMKDEKGTFYPQNKTYVSTAKMVEMIAENAGKKIKIVSVLNPAVYLACKMPGKIGKLANKAFGNLVYDKSLSDKYAQEYQVYGLKESVERTEK